MRLGLFGGAFDPVHYGHLLLAEQCREQCRLDEIWLIPTGQPPHKDPHELTPGRQRAEMLELAVAGNPTYQVSRMELEHSGTSYTFETLQRLHGEDADRELFFLIGADSLHDLPTWREPKRIAELATIVAVNRGGQPEPDFESIRTKVGDAVATRIQSITIPGIELSSSDIRSRVRQGKSIRFMTPRAIEAYIEQHKLYEAGAETSSSQSSACE